jgi:polyhydroxybutyrate depolymerase
MQRLATTIGSLCILLSVEATAQVRARPSRGAPADRETIRHDGRDRSFILRAPRVIAPETRVALVIVLHGGGGSASNAESMSRFTERAQAEGFIVVYPDGTGPRRDALLTWNAGHCCGSAMNQRIDDVGFIRALIDHLQARYPIDSRRIYATGMSNGAMMSHRLGIELSDRIAAIAPVVGAVFGDEARPGAPVSAIIINGMLDRAVPYAGGTPGGRFTQAWDGTPTRPALEQANFWATANGCNATPRQVDRGRYVSTTYSCPGRLDVVHYGVEDNGHAWPGGQKGSRLGDTPSSAIRATDLIWEFFKAHPKN